MFKLSFDGLVHALVDTFSNTNGLPPTIDQVLEMAQGLAVKVNFDGSVTDAVNEAMLNINVRMGIGHSLVDDEAVHDARWIESAEFDFDYSKNYSSYLRDSGWNTEVIGTLDTVTSKILGLLQNPKDEGNWKRRGLVIGHVQSGKTANYLGLIAKAADAGYKFIVIVAGIHNNLRRQTQERVDSGFVGMASDPTDKSIIGVGNYHTHVQPVALTTVMDDFKKSDASKVRSKITDWNKPVVIVIKKNVSTLNQIYNWLCDFNVKAGQDKIENAPMLFIDDEADNASINTNKEDVDPTRTNSLIRKLLSLFSKNCYVGYTATPFANIFINPEAYGDTEVCEDLFPSDFIYCLDAPNNYFGADKIFIDEDGEQKFIRPITDAEDILPLSHKKDIEFSDIPASLKNAINLFVLTRAIRNLRGQSKKHCSMLINVSRFVATQRSVRALVDTYVKKLADSIRANYALDDKHSSNDKFFASLKEAFNTEYSEAGVTWGKLKSELDTAISSVKSFLVNSTKSDETLDYASYEKSGEALTAIAIGGLSLSRGLTIEGLSISYMYRNTKMYDTLFQMGRWFGYRPGYEDLCRIYLSPDSIGWYSHIAEAAEELRDSIKIMRQSKRTPKDFGLMVQAHEDSLMVTAANKMRSSETRPIVIGYEGRLKETFILPSDEETNSSNRQLVHELFDTLSSGSFASKVCEGEERKACKVWRGISAGQVKEFVSNFKWHSDHEFTKKTCILFLDKIRDRFPEWDIAFISPETKTTPVETFGGGFAMGTQRRTVSMSGENFIIPQSGTGYFASKKQRLASRLDERVGLSKDELKRAAIIAGDKVADDRHFRDVNVRGRPLLMIHLIDLQDTDKNLLVEKVPAIGLAFPRTGEPNTIEYSMNSIMIKQLEAEMGNDDSPDLDEDQDE